MRGHLLWTHEIVEEFSSLHWGEIDGSVLRLEGMHVPTISWWLVDDLLVFLDCLPK